MTSGLLAVLALVFYALAMAGFIVFLIRRNKKAALVANYVLIAGLVLHTIELAMRTAQLGQIPVLNVAESLRFFAWALILGYLILYWRYKLPILGAFAAPLAVVLMLVGVLLKQGPANTGPLYQSLWLTLHLATVFGGYAFFGLAFVGGIIYLIQEKQLKAKRMGAVLQRLPSLNVLDQINYYCLTIGFPLMTAGIITGAVLSRISFGSYWRWDPKEVWTLITWLIYAALLHQRVTVGWRGRRAAILAIVGFMVLCFTFLGVNYLVPSYHNFEGLERLRTQ